METLIFILLSIVCIVLIVVLVPYIVAIPLGIIKAIWHIVSGHENDPEIVELKRPRCARWPPRKRHARKGGNTFGDLYISSNDLYSSPISLFIFSFALRSWAWLRHKLTKMQIRKKKGKRKRKRSVRCGIKKTAEAGLPKYCHVKDLAEY